MSDITVSRSEAPLANFYQEAQPWVMKARCTGAPLDIFFGHGHIEARNICSDCQVRVECGTQALKEEAGKRVEERWGIRAGMTPAQRVSVERRGGLKGRDPLLLVMGYDGKRKIPPVPDEGDRWSRHHTTLARKVVRWLADEIAVGQVLPSQAVIAHQLGAAPAPLRRVLDALVQDGTLDFAPGPGRTGPGNAGKTNAYVRRRSAHAIGSRLPAYFLGD